MTEKVRRVPLELIFDFDGQMNAFGALESLPDGQRKIHINMAAILWSCAKEKDAQWKELTADTVLHEVLHAVQGELGRLFTEAEVDAAIDAARGITPAEYDAIPDSEPAFDPYTTTLARAERAEAQVRTWRRRLAIAGLCLVSTLFLSIVGTALFPRWQDAWLAPTVAVTVLAILSLAEWAVGVIRGAR